MKLYHGTTDRHAAAIRNQGLRPRGRRKGNWPGSPSGPDRVYLTDCYAPYFAGTAQGGGNWLILEVDTELLDTDGFVPDEDFLEQTSRNQTGKGLPPAGLDMLGRTRWFRDRSLRFQHHWEDSIRCLGTCAYLGPVPSRAITRAAYFDPMSNPTLASWAMGPTISLINRMLCGNMYKAITGWFFGENPTPAEIQTHSLCGTAGFIDDKMVEAYAKVLAKREGLRIETWAAANIEA